MKSVVIFFAKHSFWSAVLIATARCLQAAGQSGFQRPERAAPLLLAVLPASRLPQGIKA